MAKKILAAICAISLSILCMNFAVFAEESDLTAEKNILQELGIMPEERITKNNFIHSLAGFLYDDPDSIDSAEGFAESFGLSDGEYNGNLPITLDEAIKYSVIIAGYGSQVSVESDYKKIASDIKITKGITSSTSGTLKHDDAVKILYNLLDVEPMVMLYNGYKIATGETLLSINRDIVKVYGLMTANSYTSIYEEYGAGEESVTIGGITYAVTNDEQNNYLGKNVVAYVQGEENDDKTAIYVGDRKNKNDIVIIDSNDIETVESDFSEIEYINEKERVDYVKLDEVPRVIFNGIYHGQYTVDDIAPDIGNVELIDNDNDGKYEIVKVTSYETMIVSVADAGDKTIRNKLSFDGCIDVLELENGNNVEYWIYDQNGEVSFSSIMTGDVLSVARSKGIGDQIVKIYISNNEPFNGRVTSLMYDENTVQINKDDYYISEDLKKVITAESIPFSVGESFTFYIDYFGNVAYVDYLKNSEYNVVRRIYMDENDKVVVEFMDLNEIWQKCQLASKVYIDGQRYSDHVAYDELKNYEPQVMILKFNASGEINKIDIAHETMLNMDGEFTKTPEASYPYRLEPKSFGMQIFLENSAKLIVIPKDDIKNKEKYYVTNAVGSFSSNKTYTVTAYDVDEYGFTNLLMLKTDLEYEKTRIKNKMFIVTKVKQSLVDDEVRPVIMGQMGEYKNMTVIGANEGVYDGIKPGDVINISTNMKGEATYVKKLISLDSFAPINANSMYESRIIVAGTIEGIDAQAGKLRVNIGKSTVLRMNGQMDVCVYDPETRQCEVKTTFDLAKGDKVVLKVEYGTVAEISAVK